MSAGMLPFYLVVLANTLLRDPELKPLLFWSGRFQPYGASLFVHDIQQARDCPTSFVSVAELLSCSTRQRHGFVVTPITRSAPPH